MSNRARVKHTLESHLRTAVDNDGLELHYQPKIDSRTNEIVGLEALARWPHPRLGYVPPTAFIALAEETGLIVPLGEWVLEEACGQVRAWSDASSWQIPVAINMSAREFGHEPVDARVAAALSRHGLSPDLLELEITESIFMHDLEAGSKALYNLRNMGVRCSIDDFGTGYSGLTYLSQLPIHSLKIDQSFIQKIGSKVSVEHIIDAVITLARSLNMTVVAEGVETDDQAAFLLAHRCDQMQGLLFSPPLSHGAVDELLVAERGEGHGAELGAAALSLVPGRGFPPPHFVAELLEAVCTSQLTGHGDEPALAHIVSTLEAGVPAFVTPSSPGAPTAEPPVHPSPAGHRINLLLSPDAVARSALPAS
jgi:EAL domain-containing protein (putative c-di-GMP-specific phosphodiesterase class I)